MGSGLKKTVHAAEQDRPDVAAARRRRSIRFVIDTWFRE